MGSLYKCPGWDLFINALDGISSFMSWMGSFQGAGGGPQAGKEKGGISDKQVESYNVINRFLSTFIDHVSKSKKKYNVCYILFSFPQIYNIM